MNQEMTMNEIRKKGMDILAQGLGPVGMMRFMQQFDNGHGDYTKEREKLLEGITLEDIMRDVEKNRKNKGNN